MVHRKKKTSRRLRLLLTLLFISACVSSVILVVTTLEEKKTEIEIRTIPHSIPTDKIIDGGPPKDGIPAIDNPIFIKIEEADPAIEDDDHVLIVQLKNATKIFPLDILMWHQIINDTTSDPPITVTYDPFVNSTIVYNSVYNEGQLLSFGVSGKLYESNMLMYDRQTNSLWQQFTGKGVVGDMTDASLGTVDSYLMPWKYAIKKYPNAFTLSRETGFERDYDKAPYDAYFKSQTLYFEISNKDSRYPLKKMTYGIEINDSSKAYPDENLNEGWLLQDTLQDTVILILKNPQTGVVRAFKPYIYGESLGFELTQDGIFDKKYGSKWNFDGESSDGRFNGWRLPEIPITRSYWFAWSTFHPETEIYLANSL